MRKAQIGSTDLFIAVAVFTILFVLIILAWNNYVVVLNSKLDFTETQVKVFQISDLLVKTPGSPARWEDLEDSSNIIELGLATRPNVLSRDKAIKMLDTNFIDADGIKDVFNINSYNIIIEITDTAGVVKQESGNELSYGDSSPTTEENIVIIRRPVLYETENAILKVVLWKK